MLGRCPFEIWDINVSKVKFRCLNPNSDKDPTKWGHYDPNEFAAAKNKERKYTEIYIFKKFNFYF